MSAARAIAEYAEEQGLSESHIIPRIEDAEMYVREAVAVGVAAMREGVARRKLSESEIEERVRAKIERARGEKGKRAGDREPSSRRAGDVCGW